MTGGGQAPSPAAPRARAAALLAAALGAALQVALAARWDGPADHLAAVALAWAGALALAWSGRGRAGPSPGAAVQVVAWAAWLGGVLLAVGLGGAYRPAHRLLPLLLGLALVAAAEGPRGWRRQARGLWLLAGMPLLCPLPEGLRAHLLGLRSAAAGAEGVLRLIGFPVQRSGLALSVPGATLRVEAACSAVGLLGQALALALLAICLFPASGPRRALTVGWAVAVATAVNAVRIAFLAIVASRAPELFDLFDGTGAGATAFPVLAVALLLPGWWLLLHAPRRAATHHA